METQEICDKLNQLIEEKPEGFKDEMNKLVERVDMYFDREVYIECNGDYEKIREAVTKTDRFMFRPTEDPEEHPGITICFRPCPYCNALTSDKMDAHKRKYRKELPITVDSNDVKEYTTMAAIIPPTPISKKRHKDDGLTSTLEIYHSDDHARVTHIYIPIKYCPICGKEIK